MRSCVAWQSEPEYKIRCKVEGRKGPVDQIDSRFIAVRLPLRNVVFILCRFKKFQLPKEYYRLHARVIYGPFDRQNGYRFHSARQTVRHHSHNVNLTETVTQMVRVNIHCKRIILLTLWFVTLFAGLRTGATPISLSKARQRRNELFEKEKARQRALITRIEKIKVDHYGVPEECTLLMNKGLSTPFNCAMRK